MYKTIQCSHCDRLEHPASCCLSLDHDENSGNLCENLKQRFEIWYIYQAQQR